MSIAGYIVLGIVIAILLFVYVLYVMMACSYAVTMRLKIKQLCVVVFPVQLPAVKDYLTSA